MFQTSRNIKKCSLEFKLSLTRNKTKLDNSVNKANINVTARKYASDFLTLNVNLVVKNSRKRCGTGRFNNLLCSFKKQ